MNALPELTRIVVSPATVVSVRDGDTLTLAIGGALSWVGPVRLKDVHAMELGTPGGLLAQSNLIRLAPNGYRVRVRFELTKEAHIIKSLCRPIAVIWVETTGLNVNEAQTAWLKANNLWGGKDVTLDPT